MVRAKLNSLKDTKPHEYVLRFFFGGLCTVMAGLIAKRFGPAIGGLFLAFPAIFPAGATLIEKHEKHQKEKLGFDGTKRGRRAAGIDAAGTSIGCIGLAGFAFVLWRALPNHNPALVILLATLIWLALSITLWRLSRSRILRRIRQL